MDQANKKSKTNIAVAIRFRPLFDNEQKAAPWKISQMQTKTKSSTQIKLQDEVVEENDMFSAFKEGFNSQKKKQTKEPSFNFPLVMDHECGNTTVYQNHCKTIVQQAMEGYNGTILAYGQTTSGKTHTMLGSTNDLGILLRAAKDLVEFKEAAQDRDVTIYVQYMEIYNEQICDLLDANSEPRLREDPVMGAYVAGLKMFKCNALDDFRRAIKIGEKSRHYNKTDVSERSSRSHTILRVLIENRLAESRKIVAEGENEHLSFATKYSILNFVDLAGSERVAESGGSHLEETASINLSLHVLTRVVQKLSETTKKGDHVPYRESKLTQILSSSLGGNSLCSIICTLSPS